MNEVECSSDGGRRSAPRAEGSSTCPTLDKQVVTAIYVPVRAVIRKIQFKVILDVLIAE
jgi:hypothetical protein